MKSVINEVNRPWSALSLPQARAKFSSPLDLHRVEKGMACVSEDLFPTDYYWLDCQTLFGRITEFFRSGITRYHRNRDRKRRETLEARLDGALCMPKRIASEVHLHQPQGRKSS